MERIIEVRDLVKVYRGGVRAVDGISFDVGRGEIFGFLGPNGAGKSTTILVLITLLRPTAGRVTVAGLDVVASPARVRGLIGYVSQDIAVDENLTGRENLLLQAGFYHLPRHGAAERITELLAMVDLADRADHPVSTYSGGMRKRLDIAAGLIHRPAILFLDEPTLGLDIQTRRRIWDYVARLRAEHGITIFLTTHYMEEAEFLCDRVAIIDHGAIKAIGPPAELKKELGGDLVTVRFGGGDAAAAAAGLRRLPQVIDIAGETDGELRVVVAEAETALPAVMRALSELNVAATMITVKKPSLDDVFLHFTGRW